MEPPHGARRGAGGATHVWSSPGKCPVDAGKKFILLGGDKLGGPCGDPIPGAKLRALAEAQGAGGIDLDLEGCMECATAWQGTAKAAKAEGLAVQITPFGSAAAASDDVIIPWLKSNPDAWDTVALMLYGSSMIGEGWELCCCGDLAPTAASPCGKTYDWIKEWLDSGVPKHKILLGVTTVGLERYMVDFYADLVVTHQLAGLSYWRANTAKGLNLLPTYRNVAPGTACPAGAQRCY